MLNIILNYLASATNYNSKFIIINIIEKQMGHSN